jgi:hypothetical protein
VATSYSLPSGLTLKTIHVSRLLTMFVIRGSTPYWDVNSRSRYSAISIVRCSRACGPAVNSTSGSGSSTPTLSEIFTAQIARPCCELPRLSRETMPAFAFATFWISALISA